MKLSDGKRAALKRNRDNTVIKSSRRKRIYSYDRGIVLVLAAVFAVMTVYIIIKAVTRQNVADQVPENYYKIMNNFENETDDVEAKPNQTEGMPKSMINEPLPVSCWGDSFTIAADEGITSYAGIIASQNNRVVYNIAAPDDTLLATAGRQGGIPLFVNPFIIPEDKTPVEVSVVNSEGVSIDLDLKKNAGLNPCTVAGVEGMISKISGKYYFTRSSSGERVMIMEPEVIETRGMALRRGDITVFFTGSDEMFSDPERTVSVYRKMADYLEEGNDKYIVVGPIRGEIPVMQAVENSLEAEFGEKFINIRKILCYDAQNQHDKFELSSESIEQAKTYGIIPEEYFINEDYLSDIGSYEIGIKLSEEMEKLGYFDDMPAEGN